jgi:hypothetical protein
MDGTCVIYKREEKFITRFWLKHEGKSYLEDLEVDGGIMIKWGQ